MGIQDLQTLLDPLGENVDLFRIGHSTNGLKLVLDAEGCLDRLYGGYFSDWACGGQWARCVQFLSTLSSALSEHRVSICVCFNGSHPTPNTSDDSTYTPPAYWQQQQAINRQKINNVLRHIILKGTPPPKVWWVPPVGLQSCLRSALHQMGIPVMVTSDDHHQEVVGLCRERGYTGLVGCSGEYVAFQPPRYFSSSQLKLTYRQSLETKEFIVPYLSNTLDIPQERIHIMAALLGNTLLSEQHLADFHKHLSEDQKKPTGEALVRSVCSYVNNLSDTDLDNICIDIFGDLNDSRSALLKQSVQYYINGTKDGFLKYKTATARKIKNKKGPMQHKENDSDVSKPILESNENEVKDLTNSNDPEISSNQENGTADIKKKTILKTNSNENNTETKQTTKENVKTITPVVPLEVLRTCSERHSKGLMSPSLLTILSHRQITLPVLIEDENHREFPSIHHLFRPLRQNVYAILFNLHHHTFMAKRTQKEGEKITYNINIAEWIYTRQNPGKVPEIVPAVMLDWPVPTVKRLWFGTTQDDKGRRLRAFLSCMKSDTPFMLNTYYVPQHLLILACVLRYIMATSPHYIRRHELDAFLATAFDSDLRNPLHLQEMTLPNVNSRGVQLGAMLMAGVENALLANDACGAPIPLLVASPWTFFDGKLFQQKLAKAHTIKNLLQLCDNQDDVRCKVEYMRKAILEDLNIGFPMPCLHAQFSKGIAPGVVNFPAGSRGLVGMGASFHRANERAQLEIAGVVVGHWGPNYSRTNQSARFNTPVNYVRYTPPPRGSGHANRGRGFIKGRNGVAIRGISRKTRHRPIRVPTRKRTEGQNSAKNTTQVNGKPVKEEDRKNSSSDTVASNEAVVDSTTDNCQSNDTASDNPESDSMPENSNGQSKSQKLGKTVKKNALKNKKKIMQKTDSPAKNEDLKTLESNGILNGNSPSVIKNNFPEMNGCDVKTNGEHNDQSDSHLHN